MFKIEGIGFYLVVACLVEITAVAINQWMTTFLTVRLGFSKETANGIFSAIAVCRSAIPFLSLAIFRAIKERDIPMMRVGFGLAALMFALLLLDTNRWVRVGFLALALMAMSCTSALLWSIYIPGLGKTGRVSSVNGVLDSVGYVAAAGATLLFGNVMANAQWNTVYLLWSSVGLLGLAATFVFGRKPK